MNAPAMRLDKWLWQARFFRSRSRAGRLCREGKVRVAGAVVAGAVAAGADRPVRPGDVLTFPQARAIRVVRVLALGRRRGPAPEARALYEDVAGPAGR